MRKQFITTLSGVDETISPEMAMRLSAIDRFEIGVLIKESSWVDPSVDCPRYPRRSWIIDLLESKKPGVTCRMSAHLCGGIVRRLVQTGALASDLRDILIMFDRVQINMATEFEKLNAPGNEAWSSFAAEAIYETIGKYKPVIIQAKSLADAEPLIREYDLIAESRASVLIDGSGGRGVRQEGVDLLKVAQHVWFATGYAGGLKLEDTMSLFNGTDLWWVDMESSLRTADDRFDYLGTLAFAQNTSRVFSGISEEEWVTFYRTMLGSPFR